jgi:hypothetical protein
MISSRVAHNGHRRHSAGSNPVSDAWGTLTTSPERDRIPTSSVCLCLRLFLSLSLPDARRSPPETTCLAWPCLALPLKTRPAGCSGHQAPVHAPPILVCRAEPNDSRFCRLGWVTSRVLSCPPAWLFSRSLFDSIALRCKLSIHSACRRGTPFSIRSRRNQIFQPCSISRCWAEREALIYLMYLGRRARTR